jgi:hypothetical protein
MRRAADSGEPSNREILDRLDAFIAEHRRDHSTLDALLAANSTATAVRQERIVQLERLAVEIAPLHDFRVQVETIGASVKWILGGGRRGARGSLLAALASIMALVATLGHIIQTGP